MLKRLQKYKKLWLSVKTKSGLRNQPFIVFALFQLSVFHYGAALSRVGKTKRAGILCRCRPVFNFNFLKTLARHTYGLDLL